MLSFYCFTINAFDDFCQLPLRVVYHFISNIDQDSLRYIFTPSFGILENAE